MYPAFLPSLKHMASVKIASLLYRDRDIHDLLYDLEQERRNSNDANLLEIETWNKIRQVASEKMPNDIPVQLQKSLVHLLRPIDMLFEQWIDDHCNALMYAYHDTYLHLVCVKSEGTIDRNETATKFIQCPEYALARFLMACNYCRPVDVEETWKMVEDRDIPRGDGSIVVRFWQRWRRNQKQKRRPIPWKNHFDKFFTDADIQPHDNPMRICCFFDTLSEENKRACVEFFGTHVAHEDDLRQYLYRLDREEQKRFMQRKPAITLHSVLKWPFQDMFMDVANELWNHMRGDDFAFILFQIATDYLRKELKHFNYLKLFKEFWHSSPDSLKGEIRTQPLFQLVDALLNFNPRTQSLSLREVVEMNT